MDLGLNQKVAIVCAASKGLGKASAMALAHEGADVVICARNEQALNETAATIRAESGSRILPIVCDLTKEEDIEQLVEKGVNEFGTVDILVTNVGHPQMGAFSDLTDVDWQGGYEGVLLPVIRLCRLVIPHMQQANWGTYRAHHQYCCQGAWYALPHLQRFSGRCGSVEQIAR